MIKVQVLLSTYNGECFIREQLDSLLEQVGINLSILIRDDGSKDNTTQILNDYQSKYENIKVVFGDNRGVIKSFWSLVESSEENFDYYAFCDQDDFWEKEKIISAVNLLEAESMEIPLMYCSRTKLVDQNLAYIKHSKVLGKKPRLGNALIENIATGCTVVLNKRLREELISKDLETKNIIMHDWWIYLVALIKGKVIYDENSYILYRQHGNNTVGASTSIIQLYKSRIMRQLRNKSKNLLLIQAMELYKLYKDELNEKDRYLIEDFISKRNKINEKLKFIKRGIVYRQSKIDTFYYYILVLLGRG